MMIRKLVLLVMIPLLVSGCRPVPDVEPVTERVTPKNIILFVGDGMGTTHFTVLDQLRGPESTLRRFTSSALVTTHSASSLVTDSGAATTAMAAGIKTTNGAVSVTPSGDPVETVLEIAERRGMMTGLVTTTGFWDATPAAFASHTLDRREAQKIVPQILSSGTDLVISNGAQKFGTGGVPSVEALAAQFGYIPITNPQALVKTEGKVLAVFPGSDLDLDHPDAPLPVLTRYALAHLSTADGFFLMIESEGTDSASHQNQTAAVLDSLRLLDEAVAIALDFAAKTGDTLVLFTGDHETGGLQLDRPDESGAMSLEWFSGHHTGQALPIFATGPGSSRFTGWIDNTDIGIWLKAMVGNR